MTSCIYAFGGFRLDAGRRLLFGADGTPVPLNSRAFETLLLFVENPQVLLEKQRLLRAIWPNAVVEENNLNQCVWALRRALGESPGEHRFIVTVPGVGYLFVPRVRAADALAAQPCTGEDRAIGSLAVPPFRRLGNDEACESLGLGLADALTRRLSCIRGLRVLPTSAALGLRDGAQAPGVEALLYGLYQSDGRRLRVSVQLARVCDGATVWAAKFDEDAADLFALQDSVSEQVAQALAHRLNGYERRPLSVVRDARAV